MSNIDKITDLINGLTYPGTSKSIGELKCLNTVELKDKTVEIAFKLISPGTSLQQGIETFIQNVVAEVDPELTVDVNFELVVPADGRARTGGSGRIKNILAISSGKGGVGKSTLSVNLAVSLQKMGAKVGIMDADVYGPNIPMMMGVDSIEKAETKPDGSVVIHPARSYDISIMSIGFMVKPDQAVIWRGPMLHSAVQQFLNDVEWGELDYLIIDLPPGTGDVQISLAQSAALTAGVIVTLPQMVSVEDARRGLEMFRTLEIKVLGVIENMSFLTLPNGEKMDVFGMGGGENLAQAAGVPYLGNIPMDPEVRIGGDTGNPIIETHPESEVSQAIVEIAEKIALQTSLNNLTAPSPKINISMG